MTWDDVLELVRQTVSAGHAEATIERPGLRLYVDTTNVRAQQVYAALGMNGDHYRVFEDMF